MRYRLVIFDCDGVLVDSEPIANRIFSSCFQEIGIPITYDIAVRDYVGLSLNSCRELVRERYGRTIDDEFLAGMQRRTMAAFHQELRAVPNIAAALSAIQSAGASICVASSGDMDKMRTSLGLTDLWSRFDPHIFSATQVARGKPAPDLFLHAAARMAVAPADCAVIEDSPYGIRAAKAAGMDAFGYVGGEINKPLVQEGATEFDDMADLPALLR